MLMNKNALQLNVMILTMAKLYMLLTVSELLNNIMVEHIMLQIMLPIILKLLARYRGHSFDIYSDAGLEKAGLGVP